MQLFTLKGGSVVVFRKELIDERRGVKGMVLVLGVRVRATL